MSEGQSSHTLPVPRGVIHSSTTPSLLPRTHRELSIPSHCFHNLRIQCLSTPSPNQVTRTVVSSVRSSHYLPSLGHKRDG